MISRFVIQTFVQNHNLMFGFLLVFDFRSSPNALIQSLKTKVRDLESQLKMTDVPRCLICMVRHIIYDTCSVRLWFVRDIWCYTNVFSLIDWWCFVLKNQGWETYFFLKFVLMQGSKWGKRSTGMTLSLPFPLPLHLFHSFPLPFPSLPSPLLPLEVQTQKWRATRWHWSCMTLQFPNFSVFPKFSIFLNR